EWLDKVLRQLPASSLNVLDIGTGTGVLAITVKLERPSDVVVATDISEAALKVACENANALKADVDFQQGNLFEPVKGKTFDVILSKDRKSTRLNSSHVSISYAVFCLKKKKNNK